MGHRHGGSGHHERWFLFGSDRRDLSTYRDLLDDIQAGRCFYFVLAHPTCNGRKGDRLAAVHHLRRWDDRNRDQLYELPRRFTEAGVAHDLEASLRITRWAYDQLARAGGQVWVRGRVLEPLTAEWREVLSGTMVAEAKPGPGSPPGGS